MQITEIDLNDPLLKDVMALGKKNSQTLGFFPEGAFMDHARKKNIIVAKDETELCGYVLFRITQSKRVISIVHLCIEEAYRNKGIAKRLLDAVKEKYQNLLKGITLNCREDYEVASRFWEGYGFKAVGRKRSRSKDENYLLKWWYDFGNEDLFSTSYRDNTQIKAVLDASVLIKLREDPKMEDFEVHALTADWLVDEVEFYFAPETYNEINRDDDGSRAEQTRKFIRTFNQARFDPNERDSVVQDLRKILKGNSKNDRSDRKQVAESIASGIDYFITTDEGILDVSEKIFEKYSVRIFRPSDLVLMIDQITNSNNYHSYRVAGAKYEYNKIEPAEIAKLVEKFQNYSLQEKKYQLRDTLTSLAADVENSLFKLVKNKKNDCIGFYAAKIENNSLDVKAVRTNGKKVSNVLYHQLIYDIIRSALVKGVSLIKVQDLFLTNDQKAILESSGFRQNDNEWIKIVLTGEMSIEELSHNSTVQEHWNILDLVKRMTHLSVEEQKSLLFKLERKFWPLKIKHNDIPTYIVPIKPYWASHLFDYYLSNSNLFGSDPEISWNRENVYYRSVRPVSEKHPARILWYLSSASNSYKIRQKGITACSYLDEVRTGPAKKMYREFKNFGIYNWNDIYQMAHYDANKEIKALKFSDTEVFEKVIPLEQINFVMKKYGRPKNTFASPVEVSKEIFDEFYSIGKPNYFDE